MTGKPFLKNTFDILATPLLFILFAFSSILLFSASPLQNFTTLLFIFTPVLTASLLANHTAAQHTLIASISFLFSINFGGKAHGKNLCIRY